MLYRVVPFTQSFDDYGFTYSIPENLENSLAPGMIVLIPFGKREILAIALEEVQEVPENIEIKEILEIFSEQIFLSQMHRDMVVFISEHYFTPVHNALRLFFPKNLLEKIHKNTLHKTKEKSYSYKPSQITLSEKQEEVYQKIITSKKHQFLLYGVTGSGKTQIYMKLIEDVVRKGKQVLILIPEIILTSQIGKRIEEVFGKDILLLHSGVSDAKKTQYSIDIAAGNAKIIVGTRSALFYPYNNLDIIIVDEEHDRSYISDNAPRYNATEVALEISKKYNIRTILASGTPKVTSFYKALSGELELLQLLEVYKK